MCACLSVPRTLLKWWTVVTWNLQASFSVPFPSHPNHLSCSRGEQPAEFIYVRYDRQGGSLKKLVIINIFPTTLYSVQEDPSQISCFVTVPTLEPRPMGSQVARVARHRLDLLIFSRYSSFFSLLRLSATEFLLLCCALFLVLFVTCSLSEWVSRLPYC